MPETLYFELKRFGENKQRTAMDDDDSSERRFGLCRKNLNHANLIRHIYYIHSQLHHHKPFGAIRVFFSYLYKQKVIKVKLVYQKGQILGAF